MKTFLRLGFLTIALTVFFNAFAVSDIKAQGIINDIYKRMESHRATLKTLQADVKMDKYNPQLDVHDLTQGSVIYLPGKTERNMYIRINWTKPVEEQLAVIEGKYTLYRPRLKQVITGKVDAAKNSAGAGNALSFMSMSREQLKTNYTVKYIGEEKVGGNVPVWHLELTPKVAGKYKTAEIWVDGNGMPVQAKVVENNGDATTVLLSRLIKNETISAKVFTIVYPEKGTKVIKG